MAKKVNLGKRRLGRDKLNNNRPVINPLLLILDYPFVCYYNWFMRQKDSDKRQNNAAVFSFISYLSGIVATGLFLFDRIPWIPFLLIAGYLPLRFYVFGRVAPISHTYEHINKLLKKCGDIYALLWLLPILLYIIEINFEILL